MYMRKRSLRKNNRGASLVFVIAAIALISILMSVILSSSLMNLQMKSVNRNAINNFYDAEEAMDEVRVGLQQLAGDAAAKAYDYVLTNYSATNQNDAARQATFENYYYNELKSTLLESGSLNLYKLDVLQKYIGLNHRYDATTGVGAKLEEPANPTDKKLEIENGALVVKNLKMVYQNGEFVSTVETDIAIECPQFGFMQSNDAPELLNYSIVANDGVDANNSQPVTIYGNLYAGGNRESGAGGLKLFSGSKVYMGPQANAVIASVLDVQYASSEFKSGLTASFWADTVTVNGGTLTLNGASYVADDLIIQKGADVTLSGQYYGFGNPNSAVWSSSIDTIQSGDTCKYSSAIEIIADASGQKASLDMSGLDKLLIAGNVYSSEEFLLGESLSVSSLKDVYLADRYCFIGSGVKNPTTDGDMQANSSAYKNHPYYAEAVEKEYRESDGKYYYYLRFKEDYGALYYYDKNMSKYVDDNMSKLSDYVEYIKAPSATADQSTNGGCIYWDGGSSSPTYEVPATDAVDFSIIPNWDYYNKQIKWQDQFAAYCTNLTPTYAALTTLEKNADVFSNLINVNTLNTRHSSDVVEYTYDDGSGTQYVAIVSTKSAALEVTSDMLAQKNVGLIIATGNVTLKTSFEGTIICGGKLTIQDLGEPANYTTNLAKSSTLIREAVYEAGGTQYRLFDLLQNSDAYVDAASNVQSGGQIDVVDLITYKNWSKE